LKTPEGEPGKTLRNKRRAYGTGSVYREKDSKRWSIQYYQDGHRKRESTGYENKRDARAWLTAQLNEINRGKTPEPLRGRHAVRVDQLYRDLEARTALNRPWGLRALRKNWRHLAPTFAFLNAVRLTSDAITDYAKGRKDEGAANGTINRELALLRRMLNLGHRASPPKIFAVPYIAMLPENNVRQGFVEDRDFARLVAEARSEELWLRVFLELGFTYGWRRGELLGLRVRQLNFAAGTVRLAVGTTKNREGREVAMTRNVAALLTLAVADKSPDDFVLTRSDGKPVRDFRRTWWNLCARAGLGSFTCRVCKRPVPAGGKCPQCGARRPAYSGLIPHDLRRSAAKALRAAGVPESVIMAAGGWKTPSMFRRYAIVSCADQRAAMEQLERARAKNSRGIAGVSGEEDTEPSGQLQ
jgi:integrase